MERHPIRAATLLTMAQVQEPAIFVARERTDLLQGEKIEAGAVAAESLNVNGATVLNSLLVNGQMTMYNMTLLGNATVNNLEVLGTTTISGPATLPDDIVAVSVTADKLTVGGLESEGNLTTVGYLKINEKFDAGFKPVGGLPPPTGDSDAVSLEYLGLFVKSVFAQDSAILPSPLPFQLPDLAPLTASLNIVGAGVAGDNMQVQYKYEDVMNADAGFARDPVQNTLTLSGNNARVIVGDTTVCDGAVLQLRSSAGNAPIQLIEAFERPLKLLMQSRLVTYDGLFQTVLAVTPRDRTAAYCEVSLIGVCVAASVSAAVGDVNTFRRRFRIKRFDGVTGVTIGAVTDDFTDKETAGSEVAVVVSGNNVLIQVQSAAGAPIFVWDCAMDICISVGW
jgi:hypothetical protein